MSALKAFLAGFLATLVFHQGVLAVLHGAGVYPNAPWAMKPVPPLGVPSVISLAFWGGIWGILLWLAVRRLRGSSYWLAALAFGALLPSAVALLIVLPLKHKPALAGGNPKIILGALLLNGAWGLGTALLLRLLRARR